MAPERLPGLDKLAPVDSLREVNNRQSPFNTGKTSLTGTSWRNVEDQSMTRTNVLDILANRLAVVRDRAFLSPGECQKLLAEVRSHEFDQYDEENTWPRLCSIGLTHFDYLTDKGSYLSRVSEAYDLQRRWKTEAGIDLLQRVSDRLSDVTGLPVRVATEGEQEYFAGIVRCSQYGINMHADYVPYEAQGWSIQRVAAQATFNILLNEVPGGDTIIYDRQWVAPDDDVNWRGQIARDTYSPQMCDGRVVKVMKATAGDLTVFNPRNFHEVRACDTSKANPEPAFRFTFSAFIGYLPGENGKDDSLVLWS
ncbi:hypothetical protein B9Z65_4425 [Elsinoe australis]|uniref:Prolyl 4-hydroxylase alpha subunit Fe(2+) 2OG dioxygenase domain-containing protein n=1 Tax=Elsinoe australis TaxID=40998 RepID=A0A2P7Z2T9_9PEZI|nr:hypothetical protein B9Z65_4425 [Elsinoe australis]